MELLTPGTIAAGAASLLSILGFVIRKQIDSLFTYVIEKIKKSISIKFKHRLSKENVMKDVELHDLITTLRLKTGAARAHLTLFSNGEVFTNQSPAFKASNVYESLDNGVASTLATSQNVRVTMILQLISPLFDNNTGGSVIKTHKECTCTNKDKCAFPHNIFILTTDDLGPGYLREKLMNEGVIKFIYSPVTDYNNNIIGYVSIKTIKETEFTNEQLTEVCKIAQQVSYKLIKETK